jgi:cob(I)alamin adenosyltransferase
MIFVFTGDGKGKTTAALGQALRALGNNKRVLVVQFIKSPEWKAGEEAAIKKLEPDCTLVKKGKGFVGILGDTLPREAHVKAAEEGLTFARREFASGAWDVLILDEINVALRLGLLKLPEIIDFVKRFPKERDLILTGRDAPQELYQYADYWTEMRGLKHPFQEGRLGERGREW